MKTSVVLITLISLFSIVTSAYPLAYKSTPFSGSILIGPSDTSTKHTGIILLHGSEGGSFHSMDADASILAMQGYNSLVFCYFDCGRGINGPKATLKNFEATQILDAVAWMRSQPNSNGKVVVYGFSRGAELTMVVGSLATTDANRPDALIAHSPSDNFNGPINWNWFEKSCWLCKAGLGNCADDAPETAYIWNPSCGPENDLNKMDFTVSAWLINGKPTPSETRIEIEKFTGPVFLSEGEKDEVWSPLQTHRVEETLRKAGRSVEAHYYPNGGHGLRGEDELNRRDAVEAFLQKLK